MKIEIGSLVKLDKSVIAHDEWEIRDYDNLVGLVTEKWDHSYHPSADDEVRVLWQGKGKFYDGKPSHASWHYMGNLELIS